MKTLLLTFLVILVCPFVLGDWGYSQVDDLVLEFNDKNNEDTILYTNIKESLSDKPRKINDTQCVAQFRRVLESVDNRENWALKVVDSWGKLPGSGLFWGRLVDLGNYDECISTAHDLGGDDNVFVGQYCIASYPLEVVLHRQPAHQKNALSEKPQLSFYQRGVCVPDACSIEALNAIFQKMIRINTNANITISMFRENECSRNEVLEFDTADICAIIFFGILGILVATSTTYDIFAGYLNRKKNPICIAFSMITNAEKLFKIRIHDQSSGTIECLNGLRFISIVWIIYCHIFTMMPNVPVMNYKYLWEWLAEIYPLFIVSGPFAVDTFFVLSGFLLAHHVFREMDKRGGLSIPTILKMYFHRYVRLFPVLGATILFTSTIFKYLGDGPYWKKVGLKAGLYCNEYWWSSLLYIQNFVNPDKICLIHTWYLSVDTQLYILSPLILIPLFKWGRKFVTIMILMIVASSGFIFAITMIHDINIHPLEALISSKTAYKTLIYCNIHTRSPPWLMGILLAYYMHNRKGSKNTLSTFRTIGGWLSCMTLFAIIVFAPYQAQQALDEPNFLVNAFYSSSTRILWSLAIIWIIFACCQGDGGLVNSFLSYPFWQVFGRLTYTLYIVHPMMIFWLAGTERVTVFFSHLVSCLIHSWYLSIDMQLFILAPIILIPLYKWRQKFIGVFLVLIITSAAYNFVYILQKEVHIMSAIETTLNVGNQTFFTLYRGLLARASTWLIGALLAYWIHTFKKDEYRLPCIYVLGGWLSTATLIATVVFTPYGSQEIKLDVNFLDNAFYGALARLAWGLAVAWIIFACSHGYGGFVNSFLSYPMWGVLARLTYSIYIIHVPTQFLLFAIQRFNGLLGNFISIQRLWSDFGVILTVGVLAVLTLEYPVMALEKALLGRPRREPINNGPIIHAYGTNMQQLQNHERIDTTD